MRYYINLGSNLGNRYANIDRAVEVLESRVDGVALRSAPIVTLAWGYRSANDFVNMAVAFDSDIEPLEMLKLVKSIEDEVGTSVHRNSAGDYCDRLIDIDIMAIDEMVIDEPALQVPHKHLPNRVFFLKPLQELCPEWRHPVLKMGVDDMLGNLQDADNYK